MCTSGTGCTLKKVYVHKMTINLNFYEELMAWGHGATGVSEQMTQANGPGVTVTIRGLISVNNVYALVAAEKIRTLA